MKKFLLVLAMIALMSCGQPPYSDTAKLIVIVRPNNPNFWTTSDYSYCDSYKEENGKYLLFRADGSTAGEITIDKEHYLYSIKANY